MKRNIYYTLFLLGILFGSCEPYQFPEIPDPSPESGEADFSKMIAIGSSVTAGVMDGALYTRSQNNSYAVILAEQLKTVGGGDFNLPDINAEVGAYVLGPPGANLGRLILRGNLNSAIPQPIVPGDPLTPFEGNKSTLNNFGVNGMSLGAALIPQTGDPSQPNHPAFNPHYARFASNPGTSTLIGDAAAALADGGTFFTFWLGKNDVLPYALRGGANPELMPADAVFEQNYNLALGSILQANTAAKGAVANIPDLNALPFFSTVKWDELTLPDSITNLVNPEYSNYNQAMADLQMAGMISENEKNLRTIQFEEGDNGFVLLDKTLTDLSGMGLPPIRQSNANDLATLTLATVLGEVVDGDSLKRRGLSVPIGDEYVLLPSEQEFMLEKIEAFNQIIQDAVLVHPDRLVLVDANDFLTQVASGSISAGTVQMNSSIAPPNGGFSVDGIHINARGSAFIANYFIETINQKWGSTIPKVNPNEFIGNDLPR